MVRYNSRRSTHAAMPPKKPTSFRLPESRDPSLRTGWVYRSGDSAEPEPAATVPEEMAPALIEIPAPDAGSQPVAAGRHEQAIEIVRRFAIYSSASGFVPLPFVDLALVGVIQLGMVKELAAHFGVPFVRQLGKACVGALVGSLSATGLARGATRSLLKALPVVGPFASAVLMPTFAYGATYAIGRVFVSHFESGGTLHDLNLEAARDFVRRQVAQAVPGP